MSILLSKQEIEFQLRVSNACDNTMESLEDCESIEELRSRLRKELEDYVWLAEISNALIVEYTGGRMSTNRKYYPEAVISVIDDEINKLTEYDEPKGEKE